MAVDPTYQIGEVATRTGLSLRTLRHWEEMGLIRTNGRSEGGFRLYTESDVQRVLLARALKPADFSLDELQDILRLRDSLVGPTLDASTRAEHERDLQRYLERADDRCRLLRERLVAAELAMTALRQTLTPNGD